MDELDKMLTDPWLSTSTIAKLFDVKTETVRDWIKDGKIEGQKINGSWKARKSSVLKLVRQRNG